MKQAHAVAIASMVSLFSKLITLIAVLTQSLSEIYGISFVSVSTTIFIGQSKIHSHLPSLFADPSAKNDGRLYNDKKPYRKTLYDWKKIATGLRQELRELQTKYMCLLTGGTHEAAHHYRT